MPKPVKVKLPSWAFDVSLKIAELRYEHFQNRFINKKLRLIHKDEKYSEHIESIMGYLGDIACSIFLNLDPKVILKQMLQDTDCLKHRDTHDLEYNNCNIDVKIEDYSYKHNDVIEGTIKKTDPYGCRLINKEQWDQNGYNIDYYVFGTTEFELSENYKLHNVENIWLIGFLSKHDLEKYPFSKKTPADKTIHTEAKIIPNEDLNNMNELKKIDFCNRKSEKNFNDCSEILSKIEELWN